MNKSSPYPEPNAVHIRPRPVPRTYTVRLDAQEWPSKEVGGKANGLRLLVRAGFLVPPAFCVTTQAFDAVLGPAVASAQNIEELRENLRQAELPQKLVDEISAQMEHVGARRWAVRSSGLEEDQASHSFAGQQATVLEVEGLEAVLDAIREVWASLYSQEGLLYRTQLDINVVPGAMAVVVQEMLAPQVAGVMFTVNPLSTQEREVVVSSAGGLGQSVVAGRESDTYYLERGSGYVHRHVASLNDRSGNLTSTQLAELARAAGRLETLFGGPQDVEWAYARPEGSGEGFGAPDLYLLQSRPITTDTDAARPSVWTNANVGEALPGVATPLTWSIIRKFSRKGFERAFATLGLEVPEDYELVGSFRGRIYLNLTQFMSIASAIAVLKPETLFSMAGGGGVDLVRDVYEKRSKVAFWLRLPTTVPKIISAQLSMPFLAPLWGKYFEGRVEEYFDRDLGQHSHEELGRELGSIDRLFDRTGLIMLTASSNFLMSYVITRELLRWWGGPEAASRERQLFGGISVKSAEPGLALLELGRLTRRSRRLRRLISECPPEQALEMLWEQSEHDDVAQFLAALDDFRKRYGHRAPREAELSTPRWREETAFLFEVMRSFVQAPHLPSSVEVERDRRQAWLDTTRIIDSNFAPGLKECFRAVLSFTRLNAQLREHMRNCVVESLDMYRRFFLECGRRLAGEARLRDETDVFFLTYDEISQWLHKPAAAEGFAIKVLVRKAIHEAYRKQPDPPDTFLLRGTEIIAEDDAAVQIHASQDHGGHKYIEISGLPGSSGRVTGRARVIHDPLNEDATLQPGEILVAPYTDVGWTPLFLTAAAVVMSLGGPLSHSCIVAREYGIPTVVNAKGATELIRTGDIVTVDGDRGVVYLRRGGGPAS